MDKRQAIFAAGCFWGVQYQLQRMPGVLATSVGYIGGAEENPRYADVKAHRTHHVEAVWVEFDADTVTYEALCRLFFEIHDPAQTDGIGPDIGPQYRSQIFYFDEAQRTTAEKVIELLLDKGYEVNTTLRPVQHFWPGEEYHQDYYNKTGESPYCHIRTRKF